MCVRHSKAHKLEGLPAVYHGRQSCPSSCPLRGLRGGCYAESGWHTRRQFDRTTAGTHGVGFDGLLEFVKSLPHGQLWRYGVTGDLPGEDETIDGDRLRALTAANRGRRCMAYTHKRMDNLGNRLAVQQANANGFTINLSADTLDEADEFADLGIAPVVVVLPHDAGRSTTTPAGRPVMTCPAAYKPSVSCASCGACSVRDRTAIIGFPAHGVQRAAADAVARGALALAPA